MGAVRFLYDHGIIPSIVCSTSVGSVSALKLAEGPTGIPKLETAWLGLLGNGNMYALEAWTQTNSTVESIILGAASALLADPPTSASLDDIESMTVMANALIDHYPVWVSSISMDYRR